MWAAMGHAGMGDASEVRFTLAEMARWIAVHRWDLVYRVAVAVLLLAWLRVYPMYLLTIYAGVRGIPPFELVDDLAGVHVLLAWTLIFVSVVALYLWSPLILLILRRVYIRDPLRVLPGGVHPSRFELFLASGTLRNFSLFTAAVIVAMTLAIGFGSGRMPWKLLFAFTFISLLLALSVFLFVRRDALSAVINWQGPLAFVFLSLTVPLGFLDETTDVLDSTLRQYRVGGGLPVRVTRSEPGTSGSGIVSGRLLLLGKRNAYVERGEGESRELVVVAHGLVEISRPAQGRREP